MKAFDTRFEEEYKITWKVVRWKESVTVKDWDVILLDDKRFAIVNVEVETAASIA